MLMQIIGSAQRTGEFWVDVEGPAVKYLVEVRYSGADWADLVSDMLSWLDRRHIEAEEFDCSALGRGVAVRVGFSAEGQAAAFASAFFGQLDCSAVSGDGSPVPAPRPAGDDPSVCEGLKSEPQASTPYPAAKAGVSLMITRQQKADLRELGYTDQQIREMKPEEAHRVLGLMTSSRQTDDEPS